MFKTTVTLKVSKDTYFNDIFPNGIDTNTFYNKGRCGIGATTSEIENLTRSSIIIVPNISIIKNKCTPGSGIFGVWGDVDQLDVNIKIAERNPAQKIMCTPESITKVINAFAAWNRTDELFNGWFFLLDEVHTFISEDYRIGILKPFDYFWKFDNKAMLSATPYMFSDPEFQKLHYVNIQFTEKLGTVKLVNARSVAGTLNHYLKDEYKNGERLFIFYNSVTEIVKAARHAGITDFNIYCAGDSENFTKMGDLKSHYVAEPKPENFKRVNFFTTRYFEGWDLFDDNAIIILVTDIHKPHTVVSTSMKLKQAAGRLRDKPKAIIHITNHRHLNTMKTLSELKASDIRRANILIANHNDKIDQLVEAGEPIKGINIEDVNKYAEVDKVTMKATFSFPKLDQQTHEAASNECFNHISFMSRNGKMPTLMWSPTVPI